MTRIQTKQEVILNSKEEAEKVLESMGYILKDYKFVSFQDLKDLVDLPSVYLDSRTGWTNLDNVLILEVEDGWKLALPPTEDIFQSNISAVVLARQFHETYERLAPNFGYETREESAKPWEDVPEQNKLLMIAVCQEILEKGI